MGIRSNWGVKRRSSYIVRSISICFCIMQFLSCVSSRLSSSKMKRSFSCVVHLIIYIGSLGYQILNHSITYVFLLFIQISLIKATIRGVRPHGPRASTSKPRRPFIITSACAGVKAPNMLVFFKSAALSLSFDQLSFSNFPPSEHLRIICKSFNVSICKIGILQPLSS